MHDGQLRKISAPNTVNPGQVQEINVIVRNQGDHAETFGVYVDIVPPGGPTNPFGCTPNGRIIDTVVFLGIGATDKQQVVKATVTFDCADDAGAEGQRWTIKAAIDVHADDGGACGPSQLLSTTCAAALDDDDDDDSDNRALRQAPKLDIP